MGGRDVPFDDDELLQDFVIQTPQQMVREFHEVFDCARADRPHTNTLTERLYRMNLIYDEVGELDEEMAQVDEGVNLAAVAGELADVLYMTYGTAVSMGIDLDAVFALVHEANMRKLGPNGEVLRRSDGKVLKPEGWQPADLAAEIERQSGA